MSAKKTKIQINVYCQSPAGLVRVFEYLDVSDVEIGEGGSLRFREAGGDVHYLSAPWHVVERKIDG